MDEIGAFEAKNRLSALLERAERGEEILITRRGKPVAKLGPVLPATDRAAGARGGKANSRTQPVRTLGGLKIKDLIAEGRI